MCNIKSTFVYCKKQSSFEQWASLKNHFKHSVCILRFVVYITLRHYKQNYKFYLYVFDGVCLYFLRTINLAYIIRPIIISWAHTQFNIYVPYFVLKNVISTYHVNFTEFIGLVPTRIYCDITYNNIIVYLRAAAM